MNDSSDALINRALAIAAEDAPRHRSLPDARYFWLTAKLIPNPAAQERALRPLGVLQVVSHLAVAICWAIVIMWKWPAITAWFSTPDIGSRLIRAAVGAGSLSISSVVLVGGLLCITTVVLLHSVLAEE